MSLPMAPAHAAADPYAVVRYRPEFKPQVVELQTQLWSKSADLNRAYFDWKYEQNPHAREPLVYLAVHEGRVVGMRGMCPLKWQAGDPPATFLMPYADDLVVAPGHRNRGLVTRIMTTAFADLAMRGYTHAVSLSTGQVTVLGSLAMGWKSVGPLAPLAHRGPHARATQRVRRFLYGRRLLWRLAESPLWAPRCLREPFLHLDRALRWRRGRLGRHVSGSRSPRPAEMADLVARLPYDGRIRHVREAEYFAWALRNPKQEFRFLYWSDRRLEGYLVLQRYHPAGPDDCRVNIMDWEASTPEARRDLLHAALRTGRFPQLACQTLAFPGPALTLLEDAGFTPIDVQSTARGWPALLVRPVGTGSDWTLAGRPLLDAASWDLRKLY
ncbi:MAG: GNAT family N-acetyltransferase [Candidatus Methylomirabilales bacterium]